jgi:hypothetical protein
MVKYHQTSFPATIQYEDAKDLSLGMLYASEDAYDSPLAKLTFHGASIERAAPWLEATSGMADANKITVLAADDMKGFMYCYNYSAGAAKKKYPNAKLGFISPVQKMELMVGDKLIQNLSGEVMRFNWLDYVLFFDSLEFIYWKKRLQL